jgi:hypothetical protein
MPYAPEGATGVIKKIQIVTQLVQKCPLSRNTKAY